MIRTSRREQDSIEAEASSIDRDDERLKRDEIRHSDEILDVHAWDSFDCLEKGPGFLFGRLLFCHA